MTSYIAHTSVDCVDAYRLAEWWRQVLGYVDPPDDPNDPEHSECLIQSPDGERQLLFIEVPDEKLTKNRLHFDLRPSAGTRDEEVERLLSLGATELADHRDHYGPGVGWVVLADPEGNEFCVLRSEPERAAAESP
ncbi:VOC family protein [Nocardioides donggukensis]|uniref:VOC family protein n=1 Tax=Nocardioides donggukensis TaxID=2774019 RepID=A0A927K577_9ACTN|nr:VOC family protein [Nocardioides donggukensis]MBD8870469.1 VOC family protein [Nocardioides donggukensis]